MLRKTSSGRKVLLKRHRHSKPAGPPPLPIHLPQPCVLQKMGITASGWANGGYTANGYSPNNGSNGIVYLNDQSNEFLLNQLWFAFERKLSEKKYVDFGGRFDILYGSDWRYGACTGLETNINSPDQLNGWCLPQIYGEAKIGKLKIKGGHWASMYSYEIVPGPWQLLLFLQLLDRPGTPADDRRHRRIPSHQIARPDRGSAKRMDDLGGPE